MQLRREPSAAGTDAAHFAPLVTGYASFGDRTLELIGVDPMASGGTYANTATGRRPVSQATPMRADWFLTTGRWC